MSSRGLKSQCLARNDSGSIPTIPMELPVGVRKEIVYKLDLLTTGNLHLVCKFFYDLIKRRWFNYHPYYAILIGPDGYPGYGNYFWDEYLYYYLLDRNNDIAGIVYVIERNGVEAPSGSASRELMTMVDNYISFRIVLKNIVNGRLVEDTLEHSGHIEADIESYIRKKRTIC
jgi:hypothetical protein